MVMVNHRRDWEYSRPLVLRVKRHFGKKWYVARARLCKSRREIFWVFMWVSGRVVCTIYGGGCNTHVPVAPTCAISDIYPEVHGGYDQGSARDRQVKSNRGRKQPGQKVPKMGEPWLRAIIRSGGYSADGSTT